MAGIRDVAKKANVGATTVSRVLNNTGYVSEDTRVKIEKAMKELNYTPNELARHLFHKKTGIIAVMVPDLGHPFYSGIVKNVEMELYDRGYKTMVCSTTKEHNCEMEYLDMLKRHIVDGIITGVHSLEVEEYLKIDKPVVALDRYLGDNIPVVGVNHRRGGELAAEKLLSCGCKAMIQFRGNRQVKTPSHERHETFEKTAKKAGASVYSYELAWNRFENTYFEEVVRKALTEHPEADGIFGADMLAVCALREAVKRGRKVPADLKIVAYDGTYVAELSNPIMTRIVQPLDELAGECVRLIVKQVNGKVYRKRRVFLDVELKEGEST